MKIVYLTNIAPPYRIPLFEKLSNDTNHEFRFIFCSEKEGNRDWNINIQHLKPIYLKKTITKTKDGFNYRHIDWNIFNKLFQINPDTIIITGLYPTMIFAYIYAIIFRKKLVYMTDGNIDTERNISLPGRLVRKVVFNYISSFIGASVKSIQLFESYKIDKKKCFKSCLCIENEKYYLNKIFKERSIDILYCGQLHERKLPNLLAEVAMILKSKKLSITIIGDGNERVNFLKKLDEYQISYNYIGTLQPSEIIPYYQNTKLLFFSTRLDAWGLVANEALASGTPVITTQFAGVSGELVVDNVTGIVASPEPELWAKKIRMILDDEQLWNRYSKNGIKQVSKYNYDSAYAGIIDALENSVKLS